MLVKDVVQGICMIYHPKPSKLEEGDIFYVEYVSVAPWNRDSKIHERTFKGIGSILLKCALDYAIKTLKLKPGFSLHSLKQAENYYSNRLHMKKIANEEKDGMTFFEMPTEIAKKMVSKNETS